MEVARKPCRENRDNAALSTFWVDASDLEAWVRRLAMAVPPLVPVHSRWRETERAFGIFRDVKRPRRDCQASPRREHRTGREGAAYSRSLAARFSGGRRWAFLPPLPGTTPSPIRLREVN